MIRKLFIVTMLMSLIPASSYALDPATLKIEVYRMYASTNGDCSNAALIVDVSNDPQTVDFLSLPTIGSGLIAEGTYPCVIFDMSDIITFTSASSSGSCSTGTEYSFDACDSGTSVLGDGTTNVTCGAGKNVVGLHLSTWGTTSGDGFLAPQSEGDTSRGFKLDSALTVSGDVAATFVVSGAGKVTGAGAACDMDPPTFGFR